MQAKSYDGKQIAASLYDYAMVMQSANTETGYESGYEQGNETRDRQNKEKAASLQLDQAVEDAIDQHGEAVDLEDTRKGNTR